MAVCLVGRVIYVRRKAWFVDVDGYEDCYWVPVSQVSECDCPMWLVEEGDRVEIEVSGWFWRKVRGEWREMKDE